MSQPRTCLVIAKSNKGSQCGCCISDAHLKFHSRDLKEAVSLKVSHIPMLHTLRDFIFLLQHSRETRVRN